MKAAKRLQRSVIAVITTAAMLGTSVFPAMAEETAIKNTWILNDDGYWNYYKSNGKMAAGEERKIQGQWYGFDEDGNMYSNEIFESPDEVDENGEPLLRYARPNGSLATDKWMKLNDDGQLYDGGNECDWYYFKGTSDGPGAMVRGQELTINGSKYAFDWDGMLYLGTWLTVDDDGNIIEETVGPRASMAYYQMDGTRAMDKKLALGIPGDALNADYWYNFNEDGIVTNIVQVASPSDAMLAITDVVVASPSNSTPAPARRVEAVYVPDDVSPEVEYVPGETLELKFKVELKDEDFPVKREELTGDHDIWVDGSGQTKIRITDSENGICMVEYTPNLLIEEEGVYLIVDDVWSEGGYTITPKKELAADERVQAVTSVLSSVSEMDPIAVKGAMSDLYGAADEDQKLEIQKKLISSKAGRDFEDLSSMYAMQNGIAESVNVTETAAQMLDGSKIAVTGGALNVNAEESGSQVALHVDGLEEVPDLGQTFLNQIAFEITFSVNDEHMSELTVPVRIVLPVPNGYDVSSVQLYHIHDGEPAAKVAFIPDTTAGTVTFMTDCFSAFVFAQNEELAADDPVADDPGTDDPDVDDPGTDDPGTDDPDVDAPGTDDPGTGGSTASDNDSDSDSDSDSSSASRTSARYEEGWVQDAVGWWYRYGDGSYPVSGWRYLSWQNQMDWYHFGADGYMDTGWFTDADGAVYYLNPVSNGFRGAMLTGWQQIDGDWYYFHTEPDGRRGALYVNTMTPDGYQVNEKGQRIE